MPRQINDPGLFAQAAQSIAKKGNGYLGSIDTLDSMLRLALMDWVELLVDGTADLRQAKRIAIANARILLGMEPGYELVPGWNTAGGIDEFVARELGIDEVQPLARVEGAVIKFLSLITDIVEYSKRPDVVDEQWRWQVDAAIEEYAFLFVGINHAAAELLETAEPPASAADQLREGWVTINTGEDDEGGQRIYIDNAGVIKTGHFAGKSLKQAFGKKADSAKQDPNDKTPPPKDDKPAPKVKADFTSMMGGPAKAVNSMIMDSPSALDKGMVDLAMDTVVPSEHSALADAIKKARPDLASDVDAIVAERKASQEKSQKQADEMKAMKSLHPSLASHFTAPNKTAMKAAFKDLDAAKHQDYVDSVGKLYGDEAKAVAASVMPKAKVPKAKPAKQQGLTPSQTWDPAMYDQHRKEAAALGKAAVGEWDSGATADQKAAMNWYADGGFRTVNTELRTGQPQDPKLDDQKKSWGKAFTNQELVANIDSLMAKSKTKQDVAAYRGVGPDEAKKLLAMKPGESIARPDYVSTSLNPSYAISGFANQTVGGGGVVMKINTPKGTPAMYLGDVEAELLLSRGNEFVMKGRSTVAGPNNTKVEMVEFDIKPKSAAKDPKPTKAPAPAALPKPPAGLDSFESDKVAQWQKAIAAGDVAKVSNASALDGIESDAAKAYHAQLLKAAGVKKTAAKPATVNPVSKASSDTNWSDAHKKVASSYDSWNAEEGDFFNTYADSDKSENAALHAFVSSEFTQMNGDPNHPANAQFKKMLAKLPDYQPPSGKIHRVLGFETAEDAAAYVKTLDKPQSKTFSSWTHDDPTKPGASPMNHIGLDLASQFGDHAVILSYENPKGAKDISFAYHADGYEVGGKTSAGGMTGTEQILQAGHRFEVLGVEKKGTNTYVRLGNPSAAKPAKAASSKSATKKAAEPKPKTFKTEFEDASIEKSFAKQFPKTSPGQLVGAPDGATVRVIGKVGIIAPGESSDDLYEGTQIIVEHPSIKTMKRVIYRDHADVLTIRNESLETVGAGVGRQILKDQIREARAAGVRQITANAAKVGQGGKKFNGYYTWARYGYDADLTSMPGGGKAVRAAFPKAKTLSDVMATEEGRKWWKENGTSFDGTFDLTTGSRSMKVFNAYLEAKGEGAING